MKAVFDDGSGHSRRVSYHTAHAETAARSDRDGEAMMRTMTGIPRTRSNAGLRRPRARRGRARAVRLGRTLAACLTLACAWGCRSQEPVADDAPKRSNVLLVTVDTLRLDRLGFAGHVRNTSPHLDALARRSVVFDRAYSASGWTLPSMATVLTGLAPREHGATRFSRGFDRTRPTLATLLRASGYDTRGFVSHILLQPRYGFDAGFDQFDTHVLKMGRPAEVSSAGALTDAALEALAEAREPFFVWVHYFDPHFDYRPHADWSAFGDTVSDLYDQEVAWTDMQIGRLISGLEAAGRADDTVIVVTADHGEEFGDHGGEYHYTLHEEVIRVPLLLRVPGVKPRHDPSPARQIDLLPTILAAAGVAVPEGLSGRDLLATSDESPPVFVERERPAGFHQRAVIDGGRKLVVIEAAPPEPDAPPEPPTPSSVSNVSPGVLYFDLGADPFERTPLDPKGDVIAEHLLEALVLHYERLPVGAAESVELSEETRKALQSLGYLE